MLLKSWKYIALNIYYYSFVIFNLAFQEKIILKKATYLRILSLKLKKK